MSRESCCGHSHSQNASLVCIDGTLAMRGLSGLIQRRVSAGMPALLLRAVNQGASTGVHNIRQRQCMVCWSSIATCQLCGSPAAHTQRPHQCEQLTPLAWSDTLVQPGMSALSLWMSYVSTFAPACTSSCATRPPTFPQPRTRQVRPCRPPKSSAAPCDSSIHKLAHAHARACGCALISMQPH